MSTKKKKTKSYSYLKKALDRVVSEYVRRRGADTSGVATCGSRASWKALQCGHFVSRAYLATRWHLDNLAIQCVQCNIFKKGNYPAFAAWGVDRYGMDWPARMVSLSRQSVKLSRTDLMQMIEDYSGKVKALG